MWESEKKMNEIAKNTTQTYNKNTIGQMVWRPGQSIMGIKVWDQENKNTKKFAFLFAIRALVSLRCVCYSCTPLFKEWFYYTKHRDIQDILTKHNLSFSLQV